MNHETLEGFRRRLLGRRLSLLDRRERALADERELHAEREADWEDAAAVETAASLFEQLGEADLAAVARINASLERIDRGSYGECAACRETIDEERLRAVPETALCGLCAAVH